MAALAEQDPAELLFKARKLPGVRGAYKAPVVAAAGAADDDLQGLI